MASAITAVYPKINHDFDALMMVTENGPPCVTRRISGYSLTPADNGQWLEVKKATPSESPLIES
jgi:hypothetical protein